MKTFLDYKYNNSNHNHLPIWSTFLFAPFYYNTTNSPIQLLIFYSIICIFSLFKYLFYIHCDFSKYIRSMQKLRREVEKAKRMLSYNNEALIEVENLVNFEDFVYTLTRARFEDINMVCSEILWIYNFKHIFAFCLKVLRFNNHYILISCCIQ